MNYKFQQEYKQYNQQPYWNVGILILLIITIIVLCQN